MSQILALEDVLGEASSFTQAIFLAAAGLGDPRNQCAMQVLAEAISDRLERARCIIDDIQEAADAHSLNFHPADLEART